MSPARIALIAGIVILALFVVVIGFAIHAGIVVAVALILVVLIGAGNLLYGRHSHGAAAQARKRPAQEAHDRAADEAARARRAVAEADRRGERYCPIDPSPQQRRAER